MVTAAHLGLAGHLCPVGTIHKRQGRVCVEEPDWQPVFVTVNGGL